MEQTSSIRRSVEADILDALVILIDALGLYSDATIGDLPPTDSIAILSAGGSTITTFAKKNSLCYLNIVVNGKHTDQSEVFDALCAIHAELSMITDFEPGDGYQLLSIITEGSPAYLETTPGGQFVYGSSIKVNYFRR